MNTGRTVSMFMTGSPVYKGEVNGWKSNGRCATNGSTNGYQQTPNGYRNQFEPVTKPQKQSPKSSSLSFFSCCSSDADKQQETNIFSGVDLKPIKRPKMTNGNYEHVKYGYESIGSNILQSKQKSQTSVSKKILKNSWNSPKYSSHPSPYTNESPPTLRVSMKEPSRRKDMSPQPNYPQNEPMMWENSRSTFGPSSSTTMPIQAYSKPKPLKSHRPPSGADQAMLQNEMARVGDRIDKQQQDKERYKWVLMKYDMERDNRLAQSEQLFMQSQRLRPEERISQKQYQEMKIRIEWDVAWRVFDHVNENNDTSQVIDLNCLDINEAQNITKQCIIEVAQKKFSGNTYGTSLLCMGSTASGGNNGNNGKHHLLSIICASDHYAFEKKYAGGPSRKRNEILKMIEEEILLEYYFNEEKQMIVVKIDASTMENPILKDW